MLSCIITGMLVSDSNLSLSIGVTVEVKHLIHCFAIVVALLEQTLGVPQASRLLCIHFLFITQRVIMDMMIRVLHLQLLLQVNEIFENRCQMLQVCELLMLCGHLGEGRDCLSSVVLVWICRPMMPAQQSVWPVALGKQQTVLFDTPK